MFYCSPQHLEIYPYESCATLCFVLWSEFGPLSCASRGACLVLPNTPWSLGTS
jgi:hypothetical protein